MHKVSYACRANGDIETWIYNITVKRCKNCQLMCMWTSCLHPHLYLNIVGIHASRMNWFALKKCAADISSFLWYFCSMLQSNLPATLIQFLSSFTWLVLSLIIYLFKTRSIVLDIVLQILLVLPFWSRQYDCHQSMTLECCWQAGSVRLTPTLPSLLVYCKIKAVAVRPCKLWALIID